MERISFSDITERTLTDSSTLWSGVSGMLGMFSVSEWCLLITAFVTILNFIKNWYIDFQKLRMKQELHRKKMNSEDLWQDLQKLRE